MYLRHPRLIIFFEMSKKTEARSLYIYIFFFSVVFLLDGKEICFTRTLILKPQTFLRSFFLSGLGLFSLPSGWYFCPFAFDPLLVFLVSLSLHTYVLQTLTSLPVITLQFRVSVLVYLQLAEHFSVP